MNRFVILLAVVALIRPVAGDSSAWHHAPSPFRAVFKVTAQPSARDASYFIEVPVCGLGDPGGLGVYAFDNEHRPLKLLAIGPTSDNRALVLVGREQPSTTIYAYWGSPRRAPQNRMLEHGLVVAVRELPAELDADDWSAVAKAVDSAPILGAQPLDLLSMAGNPFTRETRYLYDIRGWLQAERVESLSLFLANHGGAYLLIDGQRVIERPSARSINRLRQGEGRVPVTLREGLTPLRAIVIDPGERGVAALGRFDSPRQKQPLPAEAFLRSGRTELQQVAARFERTICPAFRSEQPSYMSIEELALTEVRLATYTEEPVTWELSNGASGKGATLQTIHVGLDPLGVRAQPQGRRDPASGTIHLAGVPTRFSINNDSHYQRYAEIMLAQPLPELDAATLAGYLTFMQLRERNPHAAPVAEALLSKRRLPAELPEQQVWEALARAAAAQQPERAREAYKELLRLTREPSVIFDYIEFLLHRQGDLKEAEQIIERAARVLGPQERQLAGYEAELALLQGDHEAARKQLGELHAFVTQRRQHRAFTVQGNAAIERVRDYLSGDHLALAEAELRAIPLALPATLADGQFALLRAEWMRRIGWPEGAIRLIDATLSFNALPAFLPDLELQKAHALRQLDRLAEAREAYAHIAERYPNHPAAATARRLLDTLPETPAQP